MDRISSCPRATLQAHVYFTNAGLELYSAKSSRDGLSGSYFDHRSRICSTEMNEQSPQQKELMIHRMLTARII
ncbi:Hypothetical predicted protein, partial [Podarcis lilfordi]